MNLDHDRTVNNLYALSPGVRALSRVWVPGLTIVPILPEALPKLRKISGPALLGRISIDYPHAARNGAPPAHPVFSPQARQGVGHRALAGHAIMAHGLDQLPGFAEDWESTCEPAQDLVTLAGRGRPGSSLLLWWWWWSCWLLSFRKHSNAPRCVRQAAIISLSLFPLFSLAVCRVFLFGGDLIPPWGSTCSRSFNVVQ